MFYVDCYVFIYLWLFIIYVQIDIIVCMVTMYNLMQEKFDKSEGKLEGYVTYIDIFSKKHNFAQYEARLSVRGRWVGDRDGMSAATSSGEKRGNFF